MRLPISLASLLLRLAVGTVFIAAGLEKMLRGPDYAAAYFASLHVIWPAITGPLVSWLEVIAGVCVMLGLLTTVSSSLLAIEMLVVLVFIRVPEAVLAPGITEAVAALRLEAVLAAASAALVMIGAGELSLDALLRRWMAKRPSAPGPD